MSQEKSRDRVGATPGKLALMAVLAVLFVAVIASNWPSSGGPAVGVAAGAPAAEASRPTTILSPPSGGSANASDSPQTESATSPFGEFAADENWPDVSLKAATSFDPLAIASWAAPAVAENEDSGFTEEHVKELLGAQNAIILMSGETRLARIGDREFKVGDTIGHFRISDISAQGVVLSELE